MDIPEAVKYKFLKLTNVRGNFTWDNGVAARQMGPSENIA